MAAIIRNREGRRSSTGLRIAGPGPCGGVSTIGRFGSGPFPSYMLDFIAGTLQPVVGPTAPTVTRSGNTATRVNQQGYIEVVNANLPRFDYDPVTLLCKGLLIEESRINLLLWSGAISAGDWTLGANVSVTADTTVSPDGTQNADTVTVTGTGNGVYQTVTVVASTAYTFSIYVKLGTIEAADYKIAFYNATGAAFISSDVLPTTGTPTSTGWTRLTYAVTTPVGCVSMRAYVLRNTAISTGTVHLWGAQLEAGAFATSYIPTTTASVTRNAEVCSVATSDIPSFSAEPATIVIDVTPQAVTATTLLFATYQTGVGLAYDVRMFSATYRFAVDGANSTSIGTATVGQTTKVAFGWTTNVQAAADAGSTVTAGVLTSSARVPDVLAIGSSSVGSYSTGHIRSFTYFPTKLTDAQIQAQSS
jgi:hypothetical protein